VIAAAQLAVFVTLQGCNERGSRVLRHFSPTDSRPGKEIPFWAERDSRN
jgi:hypothetical protein